MTRLPQGGTNSQQAFQAAVVKIFQHLIPDHVAPFVDDIPVKPRNREYNSTVDEDGVRVFVKEFAVTIYKVLKAVIKSGATFSPEKTVIGVPSIDLVGHHCFAGVEVTVEIDCLPLIAMINNPDVIDSTMMRWTAYIRLFNVTFRHVHGKNHAVADFISRKIYLEGSL
jgi:hypothetical protein